MLTVFMVEREKPILGAEVFYSIKELIWGGSTGSNELFRKIARASRMDFFFLIWLLQSALILLGSYAITRRIDYTYTDLPPWASPIDTWMVEDRVFWMTYLKGGFLISLSTLALLTIRVVLSRLIGDLLGGWAHMLSAATACACSLIPDLLRNISVYAVHLGSIPSNIQIVYNLSGAIYLRYLNRLWAESQAIISQTYSLNLIRSALVSLPFLLWEIFLFYKMFLWVFQLRKKRAIAATGILAFFVLLMTIAVPLTLWTPKVFVNPMEFRMPAAGGPG